MGRLAIQKKSVQHNDAVGQLDWKPFFDVPEWVDPNVKNLVEVVSTKEPVLYTPKANPRTDKNGKTKADKEVAGLAGLEGRMISPQLLISVYFQEEQAEITALEQEAENAKARITEIEEEQKRDHRKADRNDDLQPCDCILEIAELAYPVEAGAGRQTDTAGNALLRLRDRAAEVAIAHAEFDRQITLLVFPINIGCA